MEMTIAADLMFLKIQVHHELSWGFNWEFIFMFKVLLYQQILEHRGHVHTNIKNPANCHKILRISFGVICS